MVRRYGLRDDQWEKIESLLPGREGTVGVTAKDNRLFVEAVLYRYRAGIPWRDLPERFGDFRVIHTRHTRWSRRGVWKRVFERLAEDPDAYSAESGHRFRVNPATRRSPATQGLSGLSEVADFRPISPVVCASILL